MGRQPQIDGVFAQRLLQRLAETGPETVPRLAEDLGCEQQQLRDASSGLSAWLSLSASSEETLTLKRSPQWLDAGQITAAMVHSPRTRLGRLEICVQTDSTNFHLRRSLSQNPGTDSAVDVCLAELQTAGRGRRGRDWYAPFAANLTFSLGWCQPRMEAAMAYLPLVLGLACAEVVEELLAGPVKPPVVAVKWPNDVYVDGAKLAGLLVETSQAAGSGPVPFCVVAGIGMNLSVSEHLASGVEQAIVGLDSLLPEGDQVNRNELAGRLISRCMAFLERLQASGFESFRPVWSHFDLLADRAVTVTQGERVYSGLGRGLDEAGELLLEVDGELMKFISADVSVRAAES